MIKNYLILILIILGCNTVSAQEKLNEAKLELTDITRQLENNKTQIAEKKKKKHTVQRSLNTLNRELKYIQYKLNVSKRKLTVVQKTEEKTLQELRVQEKEFTIQQKEFGQRLRQIYKNQHMGFLEFLLAPKDMAAIMDSQYYFERIMKQDVELIRELKDQHDALNKKKSDLLKKRQEIQDLAQSIQIQEKKLSSQKVAKSTQMSRLNTQIERMEKENQELAEASSELTSFIVTNGKAKDGWFGIGAFVKPTNGWLSSNFGYRHHPIFKRRILHRGIDLAAPRGRPIKAAQSGVVLVAGRKQEYKGYGIVTVINHGRSEDNKRMISTVYAHQSRVMVKEGDFVNKGSVIGWVGSTGYSTGPHLHFEVRENGVPVNPLAYLKL